MKKIIFVALVALASTQMNAQKYFTKTASAQFDASGPVEQITAKNNSVTTILNTETGEVQMAVVIKSFVFEKSLMQDHFNENYMESEKFPKSTFKGKITNLPDVNFQKDGSYVVKVAGTLTMHGVSKEVSMPGKVIVKNGVITIESQFSILCSDFGIKIPGAVKDKLSNNVKISMKGSLSKM